MKRNNGTGLKILESRYHRNGVGGQGFHLILFEFIEDGMTKPIELIASIDPYEPTQTRIIDPADLSNAWRGDVFFNLISEAIGFDHAGELWGRKPSSHTRGDLADKFAEKLEAFRKVRP